MARLLTLWYAVRSSLWFVPMLMTACAVATALAAVHVDSLLALGRRLPLLHSGDAGDASDLLETLVSSLITMATLAISITMVVLTLATNSLGPRLIESFVRDMRTQIPLGLFLSTIVYLLLVLRTIDSGMPQEAVPHLAVTLGTVLVLICIGTLLYFVHHLSRSVVADHMIARVGDDLDKALDETFPDGRDDSRSDPGGSPSLPPDTGAPLTLAVGGYVQAVDHERIIAVATECGAVVELYYRAGHHLLPGSVLGRVVPADVIERIHGAVREAVVTGRARTPVQDPEFAVSQLVEIGLRALSSGINDPYTAIAVIDRLGLALSRIMGRAPAVSARRDDKGRVRLITPATSFDEIAEKALEPMRHAGRDLPILLVALMRTLSRLAELARSDGHRRSLAHHVDLVLAEARRTLAEPCDRAPIERHALEAKQQIDQSP